MTRILYIDAADISKQLSTFVQTAVRPLIVILGPTASGKTAYSIACAERLAAEQGRRAEIINADSRQLYTHLNIGTAKITREEMHDIPHHLIDVLDPKEEATAHWYKDAATKTIDAIHQHGNFPMLVGGSMLYISAIIDDLQFPAATDPTLRERLEKQYDADGGVALHQQLSHVDPESAAAIPRQNKPYVVRALEIFLTQGTTASAARTKGTCPYDLFIIGIDRPRDELVQRIDERARVMLASGWVQECLDLLTRGYQSRDPGMKSHGYREVIAAIETLRATGTSDDDIIKKLSADKNLAEDIAIKTRQYAKRQMTWWRGDERIRWTNI